MTTTIIVELMEGWTLGAIGFPEDAPTLRAQNNDPDLCVFGLPEEMLDCRAMMDHKGAIAAWVHGNDCLITETIEGTMTEIDDKLVFTPDQSGFMTPIPECQRRAQGGSFPVIDLPEGGFPPDTVTDE